MLLNIRVKFGLKKNLTISEIWQEIDKWPVIWNKQRAIIHLFFHNSVWNSLNRYYTSNYTCTCMRVSSWESKLQKLWEVYMASDRWKNKKTNEGPQFGHSLFNLFETCRATTSFVDPSFQTLRTSRTLAEMALDEQMNRNLEKIKGHNISRSSTILSETCQNAFTYTCNQLNKRPSFGLKLTKHLKILLWTYKHGRDWRTNTSKHGLADTKTRITPKQHPSAFGGGSGGGKRYYRKLLILIFIK